MFKHTFHYTNEMMVKKEKAEIHTRYRFNVVPSTEFNNDDHLLCAKKFDHILPEIKEN